MEQPIPAASALIIHKGKVLFVRSNTTREQWAFPGGKQEKNETPQQTVSREIKEELGLDLEIKGELGSYIYISENEEFHIRCFIAESKTFDLKAAPDKIIETKWCPLQEGLALNLTSTTREALGKFASEYGRKS